MSAENRPFKRGDRVSRLLEKELGRLIHDEFGDPRFQWVSITHIDVSRDMSVARVSISSLQDIDLSEVIEALDEVKPGLRSLLAKRLKMRAVPMLKFLADDSMRQAQHMAALLAEDKKKGMPDGS